MSKKVRRKSLSKKIKELQERIKELESRPGPYDIIGPKPGQRDYPKSQKRIDEFFDKLKERIRRKKPSSVVERHASEVMKFDQMRQRSSEKHASTSLLD